MAKNARKLLNLVDDTPIVPGDVHPTFSHAETAREVLNVAEDELRAWTPNVEPIHTNAGNLGTNAMPAAPVSAQGAAPTQHYTQQTEYPTQHSEHLTQQSEYPTQQSEYTQHADQYATSSEPSVVGQEPVSYQTQAQPTETSYATDEHDHEHARGVAARVLG